MAEDKFVEVAKEEIKNSQEYADKVLNDEAAKQEAKADQAELKKAEKAEKAEKTAEMVELEKQKIKDAQEHEQSKIK